MSRISIAPILTAGQLATRVAEAIRNAGAEPMACVNLVPTCDGVIHDCAPEATCHIEQVLQWNRGELPVPVLLLAPDSDHLRAILAESSAAAEVQWVPIGEGGAVYALDAAVEQHVQRACAAHVHRILGSTRPALPPQVHIVVRTFLTRLGAHATVPALTMLLRQAGIPPRTAERIWAGSNLPSPKRFMDRVLLLFLAVEAARTGVSITRVAARLGVGKKTLHRLRGRAPCLQSLRDLYDDRGLALLARQVFNVAD